MNDAVIMFKGTEPVDIDWFLSAMKDKCSQWGDFVVPLRGKYGKTDSLETTWKMNCKTLNLAIQDNKENKVMKYVISAPTGSAKTESLITYCSILEEEYTVLIATNLIDEADNIVNKINKEVHEAYDKVYEEYLVDGLSILPKNDYKPRAYSYHSKKDDSEKLEIEDVAKFQIIVTTHSFYQQHFSGSDKWSILAEDRDLLVIDEALETMQEYSVRDESIGRAIRIFENIKKSHKFKNDEQFDKELKELKYALQLLENSEDGTKLLYPDATAENGLALTLSNSIDKYKLLSQVLGQTDTKDKTIKNFIRTINLNQILTGINDKSNNDKLRQELNNTINSLNLMNKIGQVYTTTHQGHKSFHRVTDMMFKKSLVCFDATAEVNDIYQLRAKYYDDIYLVYKYPNVRDYSSVTLHSATFKTSKDAVDNDLVSTVLGNVKFGEKTLIVTQKQNVALFRSKMESSYSDKFFDIAHWGALTGLNNWNDFDTCIIVGLLHKPKSYAQNRVIINTDSEERAFGDEQNHLNDSIESSIILAEIIQAMNRIRIRKIIDHKGSCLPADIYILLPIRHATVYKKQIAQQMPNLNFKDWNAEFLNATQVSVSFDLLVEYLDNTLKDGDTILKKDLLKGLGMSPNSFGTLQGKTTAKKQAFKEKLTKAGVGIKEVMNKGGKIPRQYFYKIEQS